MERFFSVVVETEDGRTETLRLSGASPGAAFQQAKQTPGVRRVGKVAEVGSRTAGPSPVQPGANGRSGSSSGAPAPSQPAPGRNERAGGYDPKVGFVLSGPRVVIHARPGGEQPFRNLQAPPEQFGPPKALFLAALQAAEEAALAAQQAALAAQQAAAAAAEAERLARAEAAAAAATPTAPANPAEPQYRIYKSRRREGLPYLLQRGTWRDAGGKRLFEANWEKGFAERAQAERHLAWIEQNEREMADADPAAEDDAQAEAEAEMEDADAEMDYQAA